MCKLIAELVETDEQILREVITRLERASGEPGMDVRLTGEVLAKANLKIRELGLDPKDTTKKELYGGLLSLLKLHDDFLGKHIGVKNTDKSTKILEQVVKVVSRLRLPKQVWVVKQSAAKKIIAKNPPKKLMKLLGYRSVESMLKREPIENIYAAAKYTEHATWQRLTKNSLRKLTPSDFEARDIALRYLDAKKWSAAADVIAGKNHSMMITSVENGGIILLPANIPRRDGLTILTTALVLRTISEMRMYSTFLKFHQMSPELGDLLVATLHEGKQDHFKMAGQSLHWRVLHKYYKNSDVRHPEVFEPHLQLEDMAYRQAEEVLCNLEPALGFWWGLEYVGLPTKTGPISFNLMDVAVSLVNKLDFEQRQTYHLRDAMWDELYSRYMAHPAHETHILGQLEQGTAHSEFMVFDEMEFAV